jgi:iron complex transport system permease protein
MEQSHSPTVRFAARSGVNRGNLGPLLLLGSGLVVLVLLSLFLGRYPQPGFVSPVALADDPFMQTVVLNLRLPRILTAVLLGLSLGAAGQVFQMMFSNPLVEPGFLGVSQGAAFGAALAVVFLGNRAVFVQGSAAVFAVSGLVLSSVLARKIRFGGWILRLILAGIAVSALFTAGVGFIKYIADPLEELPEITFWLLGGLWGSSWERLITIVPVVVPALIILTALRWRLNVMSLSDEIVHSLGVSPQIERILLLGSATAATASVISVTGIVGWIGLIVPHLARRLFGVDTRYSLPGAMLIGAIFAVICDDAARTLLAGELPLGIISSFFGAVFFLIIMASRKPRRAKEHVRRTDR